MSGPVGGRRREILLAGCGKMGGALLQGWIGGLPDELKPAHFTVVEPGPAAIPAGAGVALVARPSALPADLRPDVVLFAVKPQIIGEVLADYRRFVGSDTVFLSIAAGRSLSYFARQLGEEAAIVRAMPNTPAAIGRAITGLCANGRVSAPQRAICDALLAAVGETVWLDDEAGMDALTAVSGSGPAYLFLMLESLAAAGVAAGLPAEIACKLALSTILGSAELARQSGEDPARLRENVTSPGGTTRAALDVLMAPGGLPDLMARAVEAAARRARELAE